MAEKNFENDRWNNLSLFVQPIGFLLNQVYVFRGH